MTSRPAPSRPPASTAVLLALALSAAGCGSDPGCAFGGCTDATPPTALGTTAVAPLNGQLMLPGRPLVDQVFPAANQEVHPDAPVVILFTEAMNADTVFFAYQIVDVDSGSTVDFQPVLAGDGRVLILLPGETLNDTPDPITYEVRRVMGMTQLDLSGQDLVEGEEVVRTFVARPEDDPPDPAVIATFPRDGDVRQSDITSILVVFDRPVVASGAGSVEDAFDVQVSEGGTAAFAPPLFDPLPVPFPFDGDMGLPADTRLWRWRSVDPATASSGDDGEPASLGGPSTEVRLSLLPAGGVPIVAEDGESEFDDVDDPLATFTLSAAAPPVSAAITSTPTDAVGIANLTAGGADELVVEVTLDDGQPDDVIGVYVVGLEQVEEPEDPEEPVPDPEPVAFFREKTLSGTAPITSVEFDLAELNLVADADPLEARLSDGTLSFAFYVERDNQVGHVRLLDLDPLEPGLQEPVLDTVRPTLTELAGVEAAMLPTLLVSDTADLVVSGRADERVRAATVTTFDGMGMPDLDNLGGGTGPPDVVGARRDPNGDPLFLAAPVPLDLLPVGSAPVEFEVRVFDRALNASEAVSTGHLFVQRGVVESTELDPASSTPITVEVFDAFTLEPIAGATVYTHADLGDGATFPLILALDGTSSSTQTDANGLASVAHHGPGEAGTLLTIDAAGYDLFTFHGVPTFNLSVPLAPGTRPSADSTGSVAVADSALSTVLCFVDQQVGDSRRQSLVRTFAVDQSGCPFNPIIPFDAGGVLAGPPGALSYFAGDFRQPDLAGFDAAELLQAFELQLPLRSLAPMEMDASQVVLEAVPDGTVPVEVSGGGSIVFDASSVGELDPTMLFMNNDFTGAAAVTVEATAPGIPEPFPVGLGLSFVTGALVWDLAAAFPEEVDPARGSGDFGLDPTLRLQVAVASADGSTLVARRVPLDASNAVPASIEPLQVPSVTAVGQVGLGINVSVEDVLGGALDEQGLYTVTLAGASRRWTLVRLDPADAGMPAPDVVLHAPDLAPDPPAFADMEALAVLAAATATSGFPAFDTLAFDPAASLQWVDLRRDVEHQSSGVGPSLVYSAP